MKQGQRVRGIEKRFRPQPRIIIAEWYEGICRVNGREIDAAEIARSRADPLVHFIEVTREGFGRL